MNKRAAMHRGAFEVAFGLGSVCETIPCRDCLDAGMHAEVCSRRTWSLQFRVWNVSELHQ